MGKCLVSCNRCGVNINVKYQQLLEDFFFMWHTYKLSLLLGIYVEKKHTKGGLSATKWDFVSCMWSCKCKRDENTGYNCVTSEMEAYGLDFVRIECALYSSKFNKIRFSCFEFNYKFSIFARVSLLFSFSSMFDLIIIRNDLLWIKNF